MTAGRPKASRKMLLVRDNDGNIVGGFAPGDAGEGGAQFGIEALPSQSVVEADVPEEAASFESAHDFLDAMRDARVDADGRVTLKRQIRRQSGREPR